MAYRNRDKVGNGLISYCISQELLSVGHIYTNMVACFKMEEEVTKAITTTVLKEYGNPDHSKVTKAIDFAQEKVSIDIGCLQWRKFGISVDGQVGRKSIHWRHFKS